MPIRTLLAAALLCSVAFATTANAQAVESATAAQVTAADATKGQSATEASSAALKQSAAKTVAPADRSTTLPLQKFTFISKRSPFSSFTEAANHVATEPQNPPPASADAQELAKKLANPVASLISVPMQSNFDFGMGTGSGWRYTLNVQPVIPIALSPKWNMISRTIIPIIHQGNVTGPNTSQSGLGDAVQSFFFSPNKTEPLIWAIGPVVLIPTATNASLGAQKWGLGPTILALKQKGGWTVGFLGNHIWSVAGKANRADVNATFVQPFVAYNTKDAWTYSLNTESTYDWNSHSWSTPINFTVSKLVRFGKQPISFGGGPKCWVTTPTGGPEGCAYAWWSPRCFRRNELNIFNETQLELMKRKCRGARPTSQAGGVNRVVSGTFSIKPEVRQFLNIEVEQFRR